MHQSEFLSFQVAEKLSHKRKCGLVVGMHRSGTSSVAGTLALLGFVPPVNLIGENKANPKGHWESSAVARLNDRIMEFAGSRWQDWRPFNESWYDTPYLQRFAAEAEEVLDAEFADSPMMVLKDPRICRLAKFWLHVLDMGDVEPVIFMPFRDPLEVAQSLEARNGFTALTSEFLWLRYILDAERGTRCRTRFIFSYADFVADWRSVINRAKDVLGVQFPKLSISTSSKIDDFLDADLYRNRADPDSDRSALLGSWATSVRDILCRWSQLGESVDDYEELDRVNSEFSRCVEMSTPLWTSLSELEHENAQLACELGDHRDRLGTATKDLQAEGTDTARLFNDLVTQVGDLLDVCQTKVKSSSSQIVMLQQQVGTILDAQSAMHRDEIVRLRQELDNSVTARALTTQSETELRAQLSCTNDKLVTAYNDIVALGNLLRNEEVKSSSLQPDVDACNRSIRTSEKKYDALLNEMAAIKAEHKTSSMLAANRKNELQTLNESMRCRMQEIEALKEGMARITRIIQRMVSEGMLPSGGSGGIAKLARWRKFNTRLASEGVFNGLSYLAHNPDVAAAGVDPLVHYLEFGFQENRNLGPVGDRCDAHACQEL